MRNDERIFRNYDVFVMTICSTYGVGLVFVPFVAGEEIRAVWLKLAVAALPYFLFIYLIHLFTKKYESWSFFSELKNHFWKGFFYIIITYFIVSILASGVVVIEAASVVVNTFLLPNTPIWMTMASFLFVVGFGANYGIAAITRFLVLFIFLEFLTLLFVFFLGFSKYFNWIYIPPVDIGDIGTFSIAALSDAVRYGGIFALLAFISYVKKDEKIMKPMSLGVSFILLTYITLSIVVVGTFGYEQSVALFSPLISLVQTYGFEGGMFERLDLFIVTVWIIAFYKMVIIHVWLMVYLARLAWPKISPRIYIIGFIVIMFAGIFLTDEYTNYSWRFYHINMFVYTFILPSLCLLFLLWKKKGGVANEQ